MFVEDLLQIYVGIVYTASISVSYMTFVYNNLKSMF